MVAAMGLLTYLLTAEQRAEADAHDAIVFAGWTVPEEWKERARRDAQRNALVLADLIARNARFSDTGVTTC